MSNLRILEMLDESGLAVEEVGEIVDLLSPLGEPGEQAPAPSPELAALFGTESTRPVTRSGRRHSAVAGALVLALSGVGATGLSAAANTLPGPLQHRVSQFSHHYLPFDLPEPSAGHRPVLGLPALPPTERDGLPASRSTPGRASADPTAIPSSPGHGRASSRPSAEPTGQSSGGSSPSAAPTYASQSAEPTPSPQADASGSATPTDRPGHVRGPGQPGHDPKAGEGQNSGHGGSPNSGQGGSPNSGQGGAHDGDAEAAQKPGNGNGNGNSNKGNGNGKGSQSSPGPGDPGPATPPTSPAPAPPVPSPPLPDPLSGLGPVGDLAGSLVQTNGD